MCIRDRQWREASQWKVRNIRYGFMRKTIDEGIVIAVRDVVEVLDADYFREFLSLCKMPRSDGTETYMTNQSLTLEFDEHRQRFLDRPFRWLRESAHTKVDDIEAIYT